MYQNKSLPNSKVLQICNAMLAKGPNLFSLSLRRRVILEPRTSEMGVLAGDSKEDDVKIQRGIPVA